MLKFDRVEEPETAKFISEKLEAVHKKIVLAGIRVSAVIADNARNASAGPEGQILRALKGDFLSFWGFGLIFSSGRKFHEIS